MELAGVAERAKSHRVDPPWGDAGGEQLAVDEIRKVNAGPLRRAAELDGDFRAHFKTARTDSRPYGGM